MAMAEIVVAASTIVMAKAEIVVGAFTIVMVKAEIVTVVLPFGRDWGDSRISANFSWPEGLPNYLTQRPSVMADQELAFPPLLLVAFVLPVVVVANAVGLIATDADGPKS